MLNSRYFREKKTLFPLLYSPQCGQNYLLKREFNRIAPLLECFQWFPNNLTLGMKSRLGDNPQEPPRPGFCPYLQSYLMRLLVTLFLTKQIFFQFVKHPKLFSACYSHKLFIPSFLSPDRSHFFSNFSLNCYLHEA